MINVVICGSKTFKNKCIEIADDLRKININAVVPKEFFVKMSKKEASLLHFSEIEKDDVDALLIVNETKNNIENYIGANTFAELAFGFYKGKKIFLLNDIYEPFKEELEAWEVIPLKGNLEKIKDILKGDIDE